MLELRLDDATAENNRLKEVESSSKSSCFDLLY